MNNLIENIIFNVLKRFQNYQSESEAENGSLFSDSTIGSLRQSRLAFRRRVTTSCVGGFIFGRPRFPWLLVVSTSLIGHFCADSRFLCFLGQTCRLC